MAGSPLFLLTFHATLRFDASVELNTTRVLGRVQRSPRWLSSDLRNLWIRIHVSLVFTWPLLFDKITILLVTESLQNLLFFEFFVVSFFFISLTSGFCILPPFLSLRVLYFPVITRDFARTKFLIPHFLFIIFFSPSMSSIRGCDPNDLSSRSHAQPRPAGPGSYCVRCRSAKRMYTYISIIYTYVGRKEMKELDSLE